MRWLTLLIIMLLAGSAVALTTWSNQIGWHPSSSSAYFFFTDNQTNLAYVNMTPWNFMIPSQINGQPSFNFTIWSETNVSLKSWNATYINMSSVTSAMNMSVCGLDVGLPYFVIQNNVNIVSDIIPDAATCITFNTTAPIETLIRYPGAVQEIQYSDWNGSQYNFGYNQSFDFMCFPRHSNCTPTYQNLTQNLFNWTNTYATQRDIYLTLNESVQGYTIVASNESDTNKTVALSTSRAKVGTVLSGINARIWFWVNTFYPYTDWNSTIKMEVS